MDSLAKSNSELGNRVGRKTVINERNIQKLEEIFKLGVTDKIACNYVQISESTFYEHLKKNEGFRSRIELAKEYVRIKASSVVIEAIEKKDVSTAKWWLEKRYSQEFSSMRNQLNVAVGTEKVYVELPKRKKLIM